ncbi:hypothetical protein PsYK624_033230 [Phanerochaete sordida]|uniref:Uncharacterized protein n=1 Tax=Phanerochaete sordida TaxID=48140 RepID=A0A9P3G428_9APHY|nr:hypothetical protein PsYK624_033230 [Phanerochaete sordida]
MVASAQPGGSAPEKELCPVFGHLIVNIWRGSFDMEVMELMASHKARQSAILVKHADRGLQAYIMTVEVHFRPVVDETASDKEDAEDRPVPWMDWPPSGSACCRSQTVTQPLTTQRRPSWIPSLANTSPTSTSTSVSRSTHARRVRSFTVLLATSTRSMTTSTARSPLRSALALPPGQNQMCALRWRCPSTPATMIVAYWG